jgi:sterol desaturase/sphingolipid hydroxylase (fatty acid hydroxylase superfamily)
MGFAGTVNGSFFEAPPWVDKEKAAGTTKQMPPTWSAWGLGVVTLNSFFNSPNFVWFSITLANYLVFPYDFEAAKTWSFGWVLHRTLVNFFVTFAYVGFWHVSLYCFDFSKRKYKPNNRPTTGNMIHNVWYTSLGILQWSGWEVLFMHLYATGKLPCIIDADAFASPANVARMVLWTLVIPVWRSTHFYFAHRLVHIRVLYKYVHSLHHRNTDIEPFAGLCMHPVEHLYYFSCVLPSLYFYMSPFHMMWNGMHLLLSPAASHSGWEDHMQSDQFHYLHHAKFECNYGSASVPLDNLFGTFRDKLGESASYKGAATADESTKATKDGKANKDGKAKKGPNNKGLAQYLPTLEFAIYYAFTAAIFIVLVCAVVGIHGFDK